MLLDDRDSLRNGIVGYTFRLSRAHALGTLSVLFATAVRGVCLRSGQGASEKHSQPRLRLVAEVRDEGRRAEKALRTWNVRRHG